MKKTGMDKYRFSLSLDDGHNYSQVRIVKPITISGKKNGECFDFERKSSEWVFYRSGNTVLYDDFVALLAAPSDFVSQIKCKVELYDEWVTLTDTLFEGVVPLSSIKVNEDEGGISFSPDTAGTYEWWQQHKEDEFDFVKGVVNEEISVEKYNLQNNPVYISETPVLRTLYVPYVGGSYNNFQQDGYSDRNTNTLNIVVWDSGLEFQSGMYTDAGSPTGYSYYWGYDHWVCRVDAEGDIKYFYCIAEHTSAAENEPQSGAAWRDFWVQVDEHNFQNVVSRIRQLQANFPLLLYARGDGTYQPLFYFTSEGENEKQVGTETNCPLGKHCIAGSTISEHWDALSYEGNIFLVDAINYMLTGSGITFDSRFFMDATNPVTGTANTLNYLMLSHRAFLKGIETNDTEGAIELQGLVEEVCRLFNCKWHIDAVNEYLVIEHVLYYENGMAYDPPSTDVYTDLTDETVYLPKRYQVLTDACEGIDGEYGKTDREYKYNIRLPKTETIEISESYEPKYTITYDSGFGQHDVKVEKSFDVLGTDIQYMYANFEDSLEDGYLLLACYLDGGIAGANTILRKDVYVSRWDKDAAPPQYVLSVPSWGNDFANGDLMLYNLMEAYLIYMRYFLKGTINNIQYLFTKSFRGKEQRKIRFPRIEAGKFDPLKPIKTNLGSGVVDSWEVDTDTDFINVILIYPIEA